jgi:hypothetical protein
VNKTLRLAKRATIIYSSQPHPWCWQGECLHVTLELRLANP